MEKVKEGVELTMKTGNWARRDPLAWALAIVSISYVLTVWNMNLRSSDKDKTILQLRADLTLCNNEKKEWQSIVVPALNKVKPVIEETKEKLDSIINKKSDHEKSN